MKKKKCTKKKLHKATPLTHFNLIKFNRELILLIFQFLHFIYFLLFNNSSHFFRLQIDKTIEHERKIEYNVKKKL